MMTQTRFYMTLASILLIFIFCGNSTEENAPAFSRYGKHHHQIEEEHLTR